MAGVGTVLASLTDMLQQHMVTASKRLRVQVCTVHAGCKSGSEEVPMMLTKIACTVAYA
jgi:hypothetical protein